MQEFIDSLNLPIEGEMRDSQYYIFTDDSNVFSDIFNSISLNNFLRLEDNSKATADESEFRYTDGTYDVVLRANYNDDVYDVTIEEK